MQQQQRRYRRGGYHQGQQYRQYGQYHYHQYPRCVVGASSLGLDAPGALIEAVKDDADLTAAPLAKALNEALERREPSACIGVAFDGHPIMGPIGVFDGIVGAIKWVYDLTGADSVRDAWELGKIGRYYAVEDMLTTAEAERYGAMSLREHYENVAKNGQEYDPYTTVFAKNPLIK